MANGISKFKRNLERAKDAMTKAVAAGLYGEGNNIVSDAIENAPIDNGTLRSSGYCTAPKYDRDGPFVEVGFGGEMSRKYAVIVHEVPKNYNQGDMKYLQRALDAARSDFTANVNEIAKRHFKFNAGSPQAGANPVDPTTGENEGRHKKGRSKR